MNHGFQLLLPRAFRNNSNTNQTIPVSVVANEVSVPVSQSQISNPESSHMASATTVVIPTQQLETTATSSQSNTNYLLTIPRGVVMLHHQLSCKYVLNKYCLPVSEVHFTSDEHKCKFGRDCVVTRTKLLSEGDSLSHISLTVYGSTINTFKKLKYNQMDTRLVHCFNKHCKNTHTKLPKCFHYICYMHKLTNKSNDGMDMIELEGPNDKLLKLIDETVNITSILEEIKLSDTKLIFPVCGKRCYNSVLLTRTKNTNKSLCFALLNSYE